MITQPSGLRLVRVAADDIPAAWAGCKPFLDRLFRQLRVPAKLTEDLRRDMALSGAFLWTVTEPRSLKLRGAFITGWDPAESEAAIVASTPDLRRWPSLVAQALRTTAMMTGCARMVIIGPAGLARLYPDYRVVAHCPHGHVRFERSTVSVAGEAVEAA